MRLAESEAERLAEQEAHSRSVAKDASAQLNTIQEQMKSDVGALSERTSSLELRLSNLEELTHEWIDPNVLGQFLGLSHRISPCFFLSI